MSLPPVALQDTALPGGCALRTWTGTPDASLARLLSWWSKQFCSTSRRAVRLQLRCKLESRREGAYSFRGLYVDQASGMIGCIVNRCSAFIASAMPRVVVFGAPSVYFANERGW